MVKWIMIALLGFTLIGAVQHAGIFEAIAHRIAQ